MRPTLVFLSLLLIAGSIVQPAYSQPTPNAGPTPVASGSVSPSPSPTATQQQQTTVKISPTGLELSGFPTWIIWVLLVVAVASFVTWYLLLRSAKERTAKLLAPMTTLVAVSAFALGFSFGNWWGRASASDELREKVERKTTVESSAQPTIQATQQATPQPTQLPTLQPSPTPSVSVISELRPYILSVLMLLVVLEAQLFTYIYFRWGRPRKYDS